MSATEFRDTLEATIASLFFLLLLFVPMEKVFPAKKQKILRPNWLLDMCFFLGQYLLWGGLVLWTLNYFRDYLDAVVPHSFQLLVKAQPIVWQAIEALLISDILIYWGHRLQHNVDFLWRFHKVHHSAEHLDWLAAHREHPIDSIYTVGLINLPAFVMGFPLESIAGVIAFRGLWAIYIHSNVRLPLGPVRMLIGSPEIHHWHHDLDRHAGNYANLSPLMDIVFGTYSCPDYEPEKFGIREETPKSYLGQLTEPMLPKQTWKRLTNIVPSSLDTNANDEVSGHEEANAARHIKRMTDS
jgi:sterol desaturase/sphingolipid hydroxylase (fatty acid hydroxylase superfamily)